MKEKKKQNVLTKQLISKKGTDLAAQIEVVKEKDARIEKLLSSIPSMSMQRMNENREKIAAQLAKKSVPYSTDEIREQLDH